LESDIGKNQNTFAKMQREREKKRKAEEKRLKKAARKAGLLEVPGHIEEDADGNPISDNGSDPDTDGTSEES